MSGRVKGSFTAELKPGKVDPDDSVTSGRLTIDKTYTGGLDGTARATMWTVDTSVKGSGGYVAIERFTGTLEGRRGSFTLLHQGTMTRGTDFQLRLVIVPHSATEELEGLTGTMAIDVAGGRHDYELEWSMSG